MTTHPTPRDQLIDLLSRKKAVCVVGTGVSIASSNNPVVSWRGLIENGLDYAQTNGLLNTSEVAEVFGRCKSGTATDLISLGQLLRDRLSPGRYRSWLEAVFKNLTADRPQIIQAIHDFGVPIATTNYDHFLEYSTNLPSITWKDEADMESWLHGDQDAILHLHGSWRDPSSIVLATSDYEHLTSNELARQLLMSLCVSQTLVFIGCGSGLSDPSWSLVMSWLTKHRTDSRYPLFILCTNGETISHEAMKLFPCSHGVLFHQEIEVLEHAFGLFGESGHLGGCFDSLQSPLTLTDLHF
jgi:hypothetical protein